MRAYDAWCKRTDAWLERYTPGLHAFLVRAVEWLARQLERIS